MSIQLKQRHKIIYIIILFLLRIFILWFGYDRLPYIPACPDEIVANDPAISLSDNNGLVLQSFTNDVIAGNKFFASYPPLFPIIQAMIFKLFGISPFTFRFLNISSQIIFLLLFLYVLQKLRSRKVLDDFAFIIASSLILTDPITLYWARAGRMDMLAILFGIIALTILLSFRKCPEWCWILASIFIGLALSVHLSVHFFWLTVLVIASFNYKQIKWQYLLLIILVPILVFLSIWLIHGTHYIEALILLRKISHLQLQGFSINYFNELFSLNNLLVSAQRGGSAAILLFISWIAVVLRFLSISKDKKNKNSEWSHWIYIALICSLGYLVILHFFSPRVVISRIVVLLPLALLWLAIAISHLSINIRRSLALLFLLIIVIQCVGLGIFFNKLCIEWQVRDPNRFDSLVKSLPTSKRIATDPQLWFAFTKSHYPVQVLYDYAHAVSENYTNDWLSDPNVLSKFDIVILDSSSPLLLNSNIVTRKIHKVFKAQNRSYVVIYK